MVAAAAPMSFSSVGQVLERITKTQVPAVFKTFEDAVERRAPMASAGGIARACRGSQTVPPAILGDSVRLKRILFNLLNTRVEFID